MGSVPGLVKPRERLQPFGAALRIGEELPRVEEESPPLSPSAAGGAAAGMGLGLEAALAVCTSACPEKRNRRVRWAAKCARSLSASPPYAMVTASAHWVAIATSIASEPHSGRGAIVGEHAKMSSSVTGGEGMRGGVLLRLLL